jgi:hypothetical protein
MASSAGTVVAANSFRAAAGGPLLGGAARQDDGSRKLSGLHLNYETANS